MKIGYVCNEYPPGPHGGIGTLTQVLARMLARAGHSVRVVGLYPHNYPAPDYEEDQGVQVWRLRESVGRFGWAIARYQLYRTVSNWARKQEVDLVEVPDYHGAASGWPALPVPLVARLSGAASYFDAEMARPLNRKTFWLERSSIRRADYWCSESYYTAEKTRQLFKLTSEARAILYNPVEVPSSPHSARRIRNRVVFAGTLTAKKGIFSLLKAWPQVRQQCAEAELHIWGKDTTNAEGYSILSLLKSQIDGALTGTVHFHDQVSLIELLEVFQSAHAVVLPSYAEGFAMTPLHAMACGCPVIYTRRGSGPELIRHGREGLLVDPDQPEEIANAIVLILQQKGLPEELGAAARERVRAEFTVERLLPQNEAFYEECIRCFRGATDRS